LFGSRNYRDGVTITGHNRTINREKLDLSHLESTLKNPESLRYQVFTAYTQLLRSRNAQPAFHPLGAQRIVDIDPSLFVVERRSRAGDALIFAIHNVTENTITTEFPTELRTTSWHDIISGTTFTPSISLRLSPYQILWLRAGWVK
jgi:sucrose phosphorylase